MIQNGRPRPLAKPRRMTFNTFVSDHDPGIRRNRRIVAMTHPDDGPAIIFCSTVRMYVHVRASAGDLE